MIKITTKTLKERGVPQDSHFSFYLDDQSFHSEHSVNWSDNSKQKTVDYFGNTKMVFVSNLPITQIHIKHGDLEHKLDVPSNCEVYQAIRSETTFLQDKTKKDIILGRVVGLVKDGKVIEEYFLNGIYNEIQGIKL